MNKTRIKHKILTQSIDVVALRTKLMLKTVSVENLKARYEIPQAMV